MSGGVDSSITALLLKQQGFHPIGVTMQIWDGEVPMPPSTRSGCFGPGEEEDIESARRIASQLNIPLHVIPLAEEYRRYVLDYFRDEYRRGRTPNPCIMCNRHVKFGFLVDRARQSGIEFDLFATGHYARVELNPSTGRHVLKRGVDPSKDQSYFLSLLTQSQLSRMKLPLGGMTKDAVREHAVAAGWRSLASKPESQDFIECDDYSVLFDASDSMPGEIVDADGRVLGNHRGLVHYTVGQRKGLGITGSPLPLYVVKLDTRNNRLVVGPRETLLCSSCRVTNCNWIALESAPDNLSATVKIRSQHSASPATIRKEDDTSVMVDFAEPQLSITPGQIAAFYNGDDVLGAGVIEDARETRT